MYNISFFGVKGKLILFGRWFWIFTFFIPKNLTYTLRIPKNRSNKGRSCVRKEFANFFILNVERNHGKEGDNKCTDGGENMSLVIWEIGISKHTNIVENNIQYTDRQYRA